MSWLRLFEGLLAKRWLLGLGLLALCVGAGLGAVRVPVDPSVERMVREEPLSRMLVHPSRELAVVQVVLETGSGAERILAERAFTVMAEARLSRHEGPELKLRLSGAPAVRATLARMVEEDMGRLLPLALLVILGLVAFAYRDGWAVLATAATLVASWVWMVGAMGWLQVPLGVLTSFAPLVILIVSLTDTVHVLSDLEERRRAGTPYARALAEAMAGAAGPCLATELVIASGFLSMGLIGLTAVWEFGLATALGVLLAWGANMLVLPWVLSLRPRVSAARARRELKATRTRPLDALLGWVERQVVHHPRRVGAVVAVVALLSVLSMTRLQREFRVFDDLRPDSALASELAYAEGALGGLVPLAVFLESEGGGTALTPEAMAFQRRTDAFLSELAEKPPVVSLPRLLEPVHRAVWGPLGRSFDGTEGWTTHAPDMRCHLRGGSLRCPFLVTGPEPVRGRGVCSSIPGVAWGGWCWWARWPTWRWWCCCACRASAPSPS